jgi:hypothetical protein
MQFMLNIRHAEIDFFPSLSLTPLAPYLDLHIAEYLWYLNRVSEYGGDGI